MGSPQQDTPSPEEDQGHVFLTIHHRAALSTGENRVRLNHDAFHWGILATFKSLDGDGTVPAHRDTRDRIGDSVRRVRFYGPPENPARSHKDSYVGLLLIGAIPPSVRVPEFVVRAYLDRTLIGTALPTANIRANATGRIPSSLLWAVSALDVLQTLGLAFDFTSMDFLNYALQFADRMFAPRAAAILSAAAESSTKPVQIPVPTGLRPGGGGASPGSVGMGSPETVVSVASSATSVGSKDLAAYRADPGSGDESEEEKLDDGEAESSAAYYQPQLAQYLTLGGTPYQTPAPYDGFDLGGLGFHGGSNSIFPL